MAGRNTYLYYLFALAYECCFLVIILDNLKDTYWRICACEKSSDQNLEMKAALVDQIF